MSQDLDELLQLLALVWTGVGIALIAAVVGAICYLLGRARGQR